MTLRVALYARYSSDLQNAASIEDQIRLCRERAAREGWTVVGSYEDAGLSGSNMVQRPGVQRLLQDGREQRFDLVLSEALDRLSRNQADIASIYENLAFAGVGIVTLSEGRVDEMHVGLKGTMNALFLKDLAQKTHRGLRGRVEAGKSGGGNAYGYTVLRSLTEDGDLKRGDREIDEGEAAVVRRIFRAYAEGQSPNRIADLLNREGIPGPRGRAWDKSTIHGNPKRGTGVLNNEIYIGRLVWNRQRFVKDPRTGRRQARPNPEADWIVTDVPELRIIGQDLWDRVKARQQGRKIEHTDREAWERRKPRFLLTGLVKCGCCGGGLAPYVVRRQRACIGESRQRRDGLFKYPTIKSERRDTQLTDEQQKVIARIKQLAEAITSGVTLVSADPQRAAQTEIKFHDKSRIHIRNFLALLRSSITFARVEWERERDTDADQRGRRSLGESLRQTERYSRRPLAVPPGELKDEIGDSEGTSDIPICDRLGRLLNHPCLDEIDIARAEQMREILSKHGHAIFLAERVGVLEVYANLLGGHRGRGPEVFVVAPGAKIKTGKKLHHLRSGAEAQEYFGLNGKHRDPMATRAMFLTFQMAEGINLQTASALGILGVTSDIKSLIQGLGRIDRIDSPHSTIHYFTFDLPGLVLSSDKKARGRVENIALLSGVGAEELSEEIKEFAAGELTDLVLNQIKKPRILRPNNYFDQVEALKKEVSDDVMRRVREAKPKGLWGAELCLLASPSPATILMLGGRTGDLRNPHVQAPRLLLLREVADQTEISGDQAEAARHLVAAFRETKRRGLHLQSPRLDQVSGLLANLAETLPNLTHWDIRPARTVSILASLARFLSGQAVEDGGRSMFGDLTLPALEKLAEAWAQELDPSWIEAKQAISDKSAKDKTIPDYLGISSIEELFYAQPQGKLDEIRTRAETLLDFCRAASEGQSMGVLDRVSTVFVGRETI